MKKLVSALLAVFILLSITAGLNFSAQAASLIWPVPGHTTRSQGYHERHAIDISDGSIAGAAVVAAMGGTVTNVFKCSVQHLGSLNYNGCGCDGFGTGVVISGTDGRIYQYAHMQSGSIPSNVYVGAKVSAGQQIGKVGTTGNSSGYHLHFGITLGQYWNRNDINPDNEKYTDTIPNPLTFNIEGASSITTNTAIIKFKTSNPYVQVVSKVGLRIKKTNEANWSKTYEEPLSSPVSTYDILVTEYVIGSGKEINYTLEPGTSYTYQAFAVTGGKTYYADTKTFTTKPEETKAPPTFSISGASNITDKSVIVKFSTSNPSKQVINQVGIKIKKTKESSWGVTYTETLSSSINTDSTLTTEYVIGFGKEINYPLEAGTSYTYQVFAVTGGKTYYSDSKTFTTSEAKTETTKPTETPSTTETTTKEQTTKAPTTQAPTTKAPTTKEPTTVAPTTKEHTTKKQSSIETTTNNSGTDTPPTTENEVPSEPDDPNNYEDPTDWTYPNDDPESNEAPHQLSWSEVALLIIVVAGLIGGGIAVFIVRKKSNKDS